MEMAAAVTSTAKPPLNPFRCDGTELPVPLLLMAKVVTLCALLTDVWQRLPAIYLPFLSVFDRLGSPAAFRAALEIIFLASAICLLFNRAVRTCCLLLGAVMFLAILSARGFYQSNRMFMGGLLFLTGLYTPGQNARLIRYQVVLVYFGAVLNKLFDADWRSGQFFENWATQIHPQTLYVSIASVLPHMMLARLLSWATIITEAALVVGFLVRPLFGIAIGWGILFHTTMFVASGRTFGMFLYAMPAAYLAFVDWPRSPLTVIYDGDCGFCLRTRRFFEKLDLEQAFHWVPFQLPGSDYRIPAAELRKKVHIVAGRKTLAGFAAFRKMLLYNPLTYFFFAFMLAAPLPFIGAYRNWIATGLVFLFSPVFEPIGESLYKLVAGNRHRLSAEQSCGISRRGSW